MFSCPSKVKENQKAQKKKTQICVFLKQRYQDSNLEMLESESSALPFGDSASLYSDSPYKSEKRGQEDSNPRPSGP